MRKKSLPSRIVRGLILLAALGFPFFLSQTPAGDWFSTLSLNPVLQGSGLIEKGTSSMEAQADSFPGRHQNLKLREELYQARTELEEFSQLKSHLPSPYKVCRAPIIMNSTCAPHQRRLFIGAGKNQGLKEGQAVLSGDHVVGKVGKVFARVSQVQLLGDRGFKLSVRIQRTRQPFVLESDARGKLGLKHVQYDSDIKKGDVLVASGWEGNFPPGVIVGKISSVKGKSYGVFLNVSIAPLVQPQSLESVFVIIPPKALSKE